MQLTKLFLPKTPGARWPNRTNASVIKSVIELTRMIKKYNETDEDSLVKLLFNEVIEELCIWVSKIYGRKLN